MSMIQSDLLLGQEGGAGYVVERSLRFSSIDSAYLSRTPASAGNRKTWTLSFWVKRGASTGSDTGLFSTYSGSNPATTGYFNSNDGITFYNYTTSYQFRLITTQVFRDYSAWYHLVFVVDTTQAAASDRVKLYVNGSQVTTFSTETYPSQNVDTDWNSTTEHQIGNHASYFTGYLADIHFIDGQALTPSSFTEVDATTGQLIPKAYTGSYGTNGFHLPFSDNSTAAALGTDTSGNGNDWTVNNLSIGSGGLTTVTGLAVYGTQSSGDITNAFDGNAQSSPVFWGRPNNFGATFNAITAQSKVRVFASSQSGQIQINQSINTGLNSPYPTFAWLDVSGSLTFPFTLTAVGYTSGSSGDGGGFSAVEVDGKILATTSAINAFAAGNDSLVDTPTNGSQTDTGVGGEVVGNYATLNPLDNGGLTLSNGNLQFDRATASWISGRASIGMSSGKWYWEVVQTTGTSIMVGISKSDAAQTSYVGAVATGWAYNSGDGNKYNNSINSAYGSTYTTNDVIGVAFDADSGDLRFYKNGTVQNSGTPAYTGLTSGPYFPAVSLYGTATAHINFGQRPFAYTAPSGYKALCTTNLPDPVVAQPSTVMDVKLYTGNGSTQTISGLGFSPDFVWVKQRDVTRNHQLVDTVRGATLDLRSNTTSAETTTATGLTAFTSDGFSLGGDAGYNANSGTYVAWTWDAGSSTVTNTQGSITSSVRANPSAGFSIVSFVSGSTSSYTVGHGLGVTPEFMIFKDRDSSGQPWCIYHKSLGSSQYLLFSTAAAASASWGGSPTSSVFYGSTTFFVSSKNIIGYCFAPVAGYSSFGSYTGNGSADGPFVYTGFRPKFIIWKASSAADNWVMTDSTRSPYNAVYDMLLPNSSAAESTYSNAYPWDYLSNGFKIRHTASNASGTTYIYAAFAESPFQYARAR